MILTAAQTRRVTSGDQYRRYLLGFAGEALLALDRQASEVAIETGGDAVPALVNHGVWKVACPSAGCPGAIDALEGWGFFCPYCLCGDGLVRPVTWPEERAEIEVLLNARPVPATRNWKPGETVAQLQAENERLGL